MANRLLVPVTFLRISLSGSTTVVIVVRKTILFRVSC
jgi:hypothetical protein